MKDDRTDALTEYKTAMTVRDGQPDTLQAVEQGLSKPYAVHAAAASAAPAAGGSGSAVVSAHYS